MLDVVATVFQAYYESETWKFFAIIFFAYSVFATITIVKVKEIWDKT
jgi:hypothetical protein